MHQVDLTLVLFIRLFVIFGADEQVSVLHIHNTGGELEFLAGIVDINLSEFLQKMTRAQVVNSDKVFINGHHVLGVHNHELHAVS